MHKLYKIITNLFSPKKRSDKKLTLANDATFTWPVIEFLKNFQKFGWKGRYISAKAAYEEMKRTTDTEKKKIMRIDILLNLIAATEDLELWFYFLKNRRDAKFNAWDYLLERFSTPGSRKEFLSLVSRIKSCNDFLKFFSINASEVLKSQSLSEEKIRQSIIEGLIIKSFNIAAKNRTVKDGLLVKVYNSIKHGYLVVDNGDCLLFKDNDDGKQHILTLDVDEEDAKKSVETTKALCYGVYGIGTILVLEVSAMLQDGRMKLAPEDRDYFLKKHLSRTNYFVEIPDIRK